MICEYLIPAALILQVGALKGFRSRTLVREKIRIEVAIFTVFRIESFLIDLIDAIVSIV